MLLSVLSGVSELDLCFVFPGAIISTEKQYFAGSVAPGFDIVREGRTVCLYFEHIARFDRFRYDGYLQYGLGTFGRCTRADAKAGWKS